MDSPVVILFIDDIIEVPPTNGVTNRFINVARRLAKERNFPCAIGDRGGTNPSRLKEIGMRGLVFPANWLYMSEEYDRLLSVLIPLGIDVVHVCNAHSMVPRYGFKLAVDLSAKMVVDMHDINSDTMPAASADDRKAEDRQQAFVANYADAICVMSSADIDHLVASGISEDKLIHSPNGLERIIRSDVPRDKKQVVFVGNLFYPPNMEAAQFISDHIATGVQTPGAEFVIVGPCPASSVGRLERRNVRVLGSQPNLSQILSRGSVGIAPLQCGSGMKVKILDYAAHELPVVCTSVARMGYPDAEGLLIRESTAEICGAIDWLLINRAASEQMGRSLALAMYEHFNWDEIVASLYQNYVRLLTRETIVKPRISISSDEDFIFQGIRFPTPMHLLESRYANAKQQMIEGMVEI